MSAALDRRQRRRVHRSDVIACGMPEQVVLRLHALGLGRDALLCRLLVVYHQGHVLNNCLMIQIMQTP